MISSSSKSSLYAHNSYDQLLNLRTTLLHMQFFYASLQQKIQNQSKNIERQHKDRLIQIYQMVQQLRNFEEGNFKNLFIVKLEECLLSYGENDEALWAQLDLFILLAKYKQEDMQQELCKLYLGNNVKVDLQKCSKSFHLIQEKITKFITQHAQSMQRYKIYEQKDIKELKQTVNTQYLQQFSKILSQKQNVCQGKKQDFDFKINKYGQFLYKKIINESKEIGKRIQNRKKILLE